MERGHEKEKSSRMRLYVITLILTRKYSKYLGLSVLRICIPSTRNHKKNLEAFSLYWLILHHSIGTFVETSTFHAGGASGIC